MQVRSGACPGLLGRESTARSCAWDRQWGRSREWSLRDDRAGTARISESWEERRDGEQRRMCNKHLFSTLESCVYVTRMKMCGCAQTHCATEKCACDRWVCVHPPSYTLWLLPHVYETRKYVGKNCREKKWTFITPWPLDKNKFSSSSGFGECMYRT